MATYSIYWYMETTISTLHGTFIVPSDKQAALVSWLEANAIKIGQQPLREQTGDMNYKGTQLISENSQLTFNYE